jgi:hypothetical protein
MVRPLPRQTRTVPLGSHLQGGVRWQQVVLVKPVSWLWMEAGLIEQKPAWILQADLPE